jgi:hypothetical protein
MVLIEDAGNNDSTSQQQQQQQPSSTSSANTQTPSLNVYNFIIQLIKFSISLLLLAIHYK